MYTPVTSLIIFAGAIVLLVVKLPSAPRYQRRCSPDVQPAYDRRSGAMGASARVLRSSAPRTMRSARAISNLAAASPAALAPVTQSAKSENDLASSTSCGLRAQLVPCAPSSHTSSTAVVENESSPHRTPSECSRPLICFTANHDVSGLVGSASTSWMIVAFVPPSSLFGAKRKSDKK